MQELPTLKKMRALRQKRNLLGEHLIQGCFLGSFMVKTLP
jgi:hypothetical protein